MLKSFVSKINQTNHHIRAKMSVTRKHDTLRNTEIKCRIGSDEEFQKKIEIAKKITSSNGTILKQDDVFFNCNSGRLKLRYTEVRNQFIFNQNLHNLTFNYYPGIKISISSVR